MSEVPHVQCIMGWDEPVAGASREALIDVLARRRVEGGEPPLDIISAVGPFNPTFAWGSEPFLSANRFEGLKD